MVMTDNADLNKKFRDYYAEQGISNEQAESFDMNDLDYVHWGHHAVAFPSFFEIEYLDHIDGWAYTGYHGETGIRVAQYTFQVGQPDPRCSDYTVQRILKATDLNKVPTILLDLELTADDTNLKTHLPIWVYTALEPQHLEGPLINTFGFGGVTVDLVDVATPAHDANFSVFDDDGMATQEEE